MVLSDGTIKRQYVLHCYGSSLVVSSVPKSSPVTDVPEIAIYPAENDTSLMVFKKENEFTQYSEGTTEIIKNYSLLRIYEKVAIWQTEAPFPVTLFHHSRPLSTELSPKLSDSDDISKIFNDIYNPK